MRMIIPGMKKTSIRPGALPWRGILAGMGLLAALLAGCQPGASSGEETPAPNFLPPAADPAQAGESGEGLAPLPTRQLDCENGLEFLDDLTVPDGTEVAPGRSLAKRWLVKNTGSCSWDRSYSFQLISGLALGAEKDQDLFPARPASKAALEIVFTAPDNPGRYNSWWQAFDPDGARFGDPVYMEIVVVEAE